MAGIGKVMGKKFFKDWKDLNDNWEKAVERNMDRRGMGGQCKRAS